MKAEKRKLAKDAGSAMCRLTLFGNVAGQLKARGLFRSSVSPPVDLSTP